MTRPFEWPVFLLGPQLALAAGVLAALWAGMLRRPSAASLRALTVGILLVALGMVLVSPPGGIGPLIRLDGLGRGWQFLFYAGALPLALFLAADDEVPVALVLGSVLGMGLPLK